MKRYQIVLTGLSVLLTVFVVIFVVLVLMVVGVFGASPLAKKSPNTQAATPTPLPLAITPQQGWVTAKTGLPFTMSVSFGVSNPSIGYACGVTSAGEGQSTLQFSRTMNGGTSWHALAPTSLKYGACDLATSPLDAKALLLTTRSCLLGICTKGQAPSYYISHDGAQTWQQLQIPSGENTSVEFAEMHWAGNGLIGRVTAMHGKQPPYQVVYSTDGGQLDWLDNSSFYTILGAHPVAVDVAAFGTALQVRLQSPTQCPPQTATCVEVMQTADGGGTWDHFTTAGLTPVLGSPILATPDGNTLYGITGDGIHTYIASSTDNGQTWAQITPKLALSFPDVFNGNDVSMLDTPDGTIFVSAVVYPHNKKPLHQIYRLSKDADSWLQLISDNVTDPLSDVSINLAGHPVALWSVQLRTVGQTLQLATATIAYHAPAK